MKKKMLEGDKVMEIEVTDNDFDEKVIEQSKKVPVVVDFWAVWCGPCLIISPVLEKLAKEYEGKFILAKLNVDENRMIAQRYNVMSIPTVKMFKGGKIVDEFIGAYPEPLIRQWLERNLGD
ncbi:MAG: thioredoxin [Candidatus Aenigmarchaeota archaeon]|nr:thioredoxin [Candidatus Aenigmarchaeota archaeon]